MKSYEEHESTVVYPSGVIFKSKSAAAIAAATRSVIALWSTPRVCVCPPREQANQVVDSDGSCSRCSGRVVPRAPFRAGEWP